jgi:hypothetical protein
MIEVLSEEESDAAQAEFYGEPVSEIKKLLGRKENRQHRILEKKCEKAVSRVVEQEEFDELNTPKFYEEKESDSKYKKSGMHGNWMKRMYGK